MTDIALLIAEKFCDLPRTPCGPCMDKAKEIVASLSRLTAPPPDEIAGLIGPVKEYLADTEHWELADDSTPDPTPAYAALNKIVVALRAQVQEIERLSVIERDRDAVCDSYAAENQRFHDRIRELERDAIRRETF